GFFWKKTTSNAALFATVGGFLLSVFFKFLPTFADLSFLSPTGFSVLSPISGLYEIPFIDRMGFVFVICIIGVDIIRTIVHGRGVVPKGLVADTNVVRAHPGFVAGALLVALITAALYAISW